MRSFARCVAAALVVGSAMPALLAQSSQSQRLYSDAVERERVLRKAMGASAASPALLPRVRALVGAYEDMSKLFPSSPLSDDALWQGARLSADAFWQFGDAMDRATALRLFTALTSRYPTSSFAKQAPEHTKRLRAAQVALTPPASHAAAHPASQAPLARPASQTPPGPPASQAALARPASQAPPGPPASQVALARPASQVAPTKADSPSPSQSPAPAAPSISARTPPSGPTSLVAIRREVLPEVLRITLELAREVTFSDERIDGPPRVFVDLRNTSAVDNLKDATIPFTDDMVKQIRIGRQADARTRVVLDLRDAGRYSIYTLYDPYRIVVDFERKLVPADAAVARGAGRGATPVRAGGTTKPATTVTRASDTTKPAPTRDSEIAPTGEAKSASASEAKPTSEAKPVPATATAVAPLPDTLTASTPATVVAESAPTPILETATTPPAPLPPSANRNGNFSLSRQLGLGISKIVIDAGHGGYDPGAQTRGLTEAELTLDIALRLEKLLAKAGAFEVVLTRRTNTFVSLEERTAIANRVGADLFLSIHSNASSSAEVRGIETYFLNFAPNPEAEAIAARENAGGSRTMKSLPEIVRAIALNNKIDESRDFASMVQNSMYTQMRKSNRELRDLGVKQAPFMVLIGATMPSILAEVSFITNRQDAALLKTDKYREQIAEALFDGVLRYQQSLKRVPAVAAR
ncbi:MAG TPA: N-acetylmuramoyl-L-alanine amidase [Vicinamibacterales bacterium]|jgi:N-acetylmuramoyl-L-alanine amidase